MSREGWICPKCNRCLSPDVKACEVCEPAKLTVSVPFVQTGGPVTPSTITHYPAITVEGATVIDPSSVIAPVMHGTRIGGSQRYA